MMKHDERENAEYAARYLDLTIDDEPAQHNERRSLAGQDRASISSSVMNTGVKAFFFNVRNNPRVLTAGVKTSNVHDHLLCHK